MPVRIYALAKQLKLDSKALVDLCEEAGVTGKGSALASLTDEEAETVKAYVASKGTRAPASSKQPMSPVRPSTMPTQAPRRDDPLSTRGLGVGGRVPVLTTKREKPSRLPEEELPATTPEEAEPLAPVAEKEKEKEERPVETPPIMVRGESSPISPMRRLSGEKPPKKTAKSKAPAARTGPTIKLAPLPTVQQPTPSAKPAEPAAQKPDIRLPLDAIRAGRMGEKPLSKHIEEQDRKRKAAKKTPAKETEGIAPSETAAPATSRGRRVRGAVQGDQDDGVGKATTLGGREQRQLKRKRTTTRRRKKEDEEEGKTTRRAVRRIRRIGTNTAAPRKHNVVLEMPCTVRTFSETVGVPAGQVLGKLLAMGAGASVNINAELDMETAEFLAVEFGVEIDFRKPVDREAELLAATEEEEDPAALKPRPPIITFLGHVDHGKTSLLDRILGLDVVSGEKGGITQHIRAYQIEKDGQSIAFVDTPGHEAFTAMRARGANVTDIAVLVVAADDGVMPQTEEAISHARAAGVPVVVALNKIDLPGVNVQRAYEQLAANELLPSEWGGDIEVVKTSATTGQGVDELLDTLLTVAELHEYSANPDRPAFGTCLESSLHEGLGVVAKVLVQSGTLRVGDVVVCGTAYGRVKAMYDTLNSRKRHAEAGPSTPVNLTGLNEAPGAGDRFHVVSEIAEAREIAQGRADEARERSLGDTRSHVTLETLFDRLGEEEVQTLNIILRADVRGSIEAIRKELTKLEHPEVQIKILQATVGGISEADVHLADASDAVIIGFSVVPDETARALADQLGVQIRRYDIIYQVADDLRAALEGMLKPEKRESELGRALVQRTFQISRLGTIAGCRVLAGNLERDSRARVIRESRVIGEYPLDSLKREKDDAREVREGLECGIKLRGFNDLKEGDILEVYKVEEVARTL
ncbi:MAG: translation initiation factor IF-2 [Pirellulaceae bacterium]|nr:translation initiation factor IF-2 [Pirellulaceae bacterium]